MEQEKKKTGMLEGLKQKVGPAKAPASNRPVAPKAVNPTPVGAVVKVKVEPSLKDLKALAIKEGVPEAEVEAYKAKAAVQSAIRMNRELKESQKVAVSVGDNSINSRLDSIPKTTKLVPRVSGKAGVMRDKFMAQQMTSIMLPLEGNERRGEIAERRDRNGYFYQAYVSGSFERVQVCDYLYLIPKGVQVLVPLQVSDELSQSMDTSSPADDFLLDKDDPQKPGQSVRDSMGL